MQMYYLLLLDATVYWWTKSESQPLYWPKCLKQNTLDEALRHQEGIHQGYARVSGAGPHVLFCAFRCNSQCTGGQSQESQPLYWPKCSKQNNLDEVPRHHEVHMKRILCST